ncbi:hypothetical protein CC78DRAFT_548116 [Lojkania enalia]|uniref:Uncharacterized protein n=1 Tax=Lojkania enalia TaxID=147567 RepID=A0A9P4K1E1_9PLEO|nr:hypothetical protein CC78DRAFT_548116 [Didymosphaeria enalia]
MPLGRPILVSPRSSTGDPRTAIFHSNPTTRPLPYKHIPSPAKPSIHNISSDSDLSYFNALANGSNPFERSIVLGATLALHIFRGTDTHLLPVAERLTIGPASGAPYYSARATPSTLCGYECNSLIVARRHPLSLVSRNVCEAEIRPRLNLFATGIVEIGRVSRFVYGEKSLTREDYLLTWTNGTTGPLDGCWSLWQAGRAVAHFYEEKAFKGLDEDPGQGIIRASSSSRGTEPQDFKNPRTIETDLAYVDFETRVPTFVSSSSQGHMLMDVIVGALFMLLTVATRKEALVRQQEDVVWQHRGSPPPYFK